MITISATSCGNDDESAPDNGKQETPIPDNDNDDKDNQDDKDNPTNNKTQDPATPPAISDKEITYDITSMSIAQNMYPGWNLANTMEAVGEGLDAETAWQNTKTSAAVAKFIKAQGFKSVRIPCSWHMHMSDPKNCKIDEEWMARVTEVVNYFVNEDLYVILNDHWDGGWLEVLGYSNNFGTYSAVSANTINAKSDTLQKIWTQIANNFKNYDEHLLFAGQNEPFVDWNLFDKAMPDNGKNTILAPILMRYNQTFVDAVRATGGNNAKRILVIQAPGATLWGALVDNFELSTDTRDYGLMIEPHIYQPSDFASDISGEKSLYWGIDNVSETYYPEWFSDEYYIEWYFSDMRAKYSDKGTAIIIGEYGTQWRDLSNKPDADQAKHDASIKAYHKAINKLGPENGMVPMVWDINVSDREGQKGIMSVLDRAKQEVFCTPAMEGIKEGVKETSWMK